MMRNITIVATKDKFIKISTDIKGKKRKSPVSGSQKVGSKRSFEVLYKKQPHPIQTFSVTNKTSLKNRVSNFWEIFLNRALRKRNSKNIPISKKIMIKIKFKLIKILCRKFMHYSSFLFSGKTKWPFLSIREYWTNTI